jgi:hypothetical protein
MMTTAHAYNPSTWETEASPDFKGRPCLKQINRVGGVGSVVKCLSSRYKALALLSPSTAGEKRL